jgi:hypothetical protein
MKVYMKTEELIKTIIKETTHWTLYDWKDFRSNYNYWDINDDYVRKLNSLKTNSYEYRMVMNEYKNWKLKCIMKYKSNKL